MESGYGSHGTRLRKRPRPQPLHPPDSSPDSRRRSSPQPSARPQHPVPRIEPGSPRLIDSANRPSSGRGQPPDPSGIPPTRSLRRSPGLVRFQNPRDLVGPGRPRTGAFIDRSSLTSFSRKDTDVLYRAVEPVRRGLTSARGPRLPEKTRRVSPRRAVVASGRGGRSGGGPGRGSGSRRAVVGEGERSEGWS
ncbi:uncharacterized protein A4U43_C08F33480 [Asparagus officinalis]|nr:uncharacterized protein A4U43_C08F33480 [Asparagus officinalis]